MENNGAVSPRRREVDADSRRATAGHEEVTS
jgi:hypothetical protein